MILICSSCTKQQFGIVHLHWSEGAVVYGCKHCGAFNEVDEIHGTHRLRVTRREPTASELQSAASRHHARAAINPV